MFIYVDESGTFTFTDKKNAWCAIAAYVLPESKRKALDKLVTDLRFKYGKGREVKLGLIPEDAYVELLMELRKIGGAAFAVAADVSLHRRDVIELHQRGQVEAIRKNTDQMIYEEGRQGVAKLAADIEALPSQLYTQLVLQIALFHSILKYAPVYFVQRSPASLANFRWRVDQKDRAPNLYERAFRDILPGLLQTKSIGDPMIFLEGEDYSYFQRFEYEPGKAPDYLRTIYGVEISAREDSNINLGKLVHEDFQYVDSATTSGVQIADLLASGIRRVLRHNFDNVEKVAVAIGANLLQAPKGETSIRLLSLDQEGTVDAPAATLIRLMGKSSLSMLTKN